MTTFVLAPDSFKESMSAEQACAAMQRGIERVDPQAKCILVPMADGGEGTVDALVAACDGKKLEIEVTGPLSQQKVKTYIGLIDDGKTAVIEMAKANGIHLLRPEMRDPMLTSTFGTGEMIRAALNLDVSKMIIGLGGSVTNDAGVGMAQALGAKFFNAAGQQLSVCGGNLDEIQTIDLSQLDKRLAQTEILIASDVNNPLCGEQGASYVFAPQKGATSEMVKILDWNLSYFADLVKQQLGIDVAHNAGAGAAGGLGFGLMAFTGAQIQSGAGLVIQVTKLAEKIAQADYVLTGEGSIDFQTKFGKTPWAVAQVAKRFDKPVIAFAGKVGDDIKPLFAEGFTEIIGINPPDCNLVDALKNAERHLETTAMNLAFEIMNQLHTASLDMQ
ncbi:glycerate kinase [Acinetobacter sp. ANC 5054]|uniref:glycerate kinase family protein n=1 Tax=Acinetobacter sp. ANC 5054 TaxID=1977877 RepID=UPI000A32DE0B|nr:glycerate kinase [Acinetobacter sp. ANC 5054]OTG84254.1 glycerate kinase [Acinetobacter sp. ANC 5054]